jgi:hypothetical protein
MLAAGMPEHCQSTSLPKHLKPALQKLMPVLPLGEYRVVIRFPGSGIQSSTGGIITASECRGACAREGRPPCRPKIRDGTKLPILKFGV